MQFQTEFAQSFGRLLSEPLGIGGNTWVIESVPPGEKVLFTRTSRAKQEEILERAYGLRKKI